LLGCGEVAGQPETVILKTSDFDYELPKERIAQHPAAKRDASRLMVLDRATGAIAHKTFRDLPEFLREGDLLVVNDTLVIPARLFGRLHRPAPGAEAAALQATSAASQAAPDREVELLLLREEPAVAPERIWSVLARPARSLHPGATVRFVDPSYEATILSTGERGLRHVAFRPAQDAAFPFEVWLSHMGHVPLPPYIDRADEPADRERYQTIFAREGASVAAPTAGLHFTDEVVGAIRAKGAAIASVTLHVGAGTFRPVATENPADHILDPEPYRVPPETAAALLAMREATGVGVANPGRVIAVGTTAVRTLEAWALAGKPDDGAWRETNLFVLPPFDFQVVEGLITNFHLPRSSLLMLVSAFAGREHALAAYEAAVRDGYRFYSYGDAMLIL
jgi:S-adenosylmethionine:tRNA ribosyltransferase-isomerase